MQNSIKTVAVIGAGTMGNGIAHVFAQKQFEVHLIDTNTAILEKAINTITKNLDRQISKGVINQDEKAQTLSRISTYQSIASGIKDVDLIIEAATENSIIKKKNLS